MKRLTDQLLTLAKNGQPLYLDMKPVDLGQMCSQVGHTLEVATNRTILTHVQTDQPVIAEGDEEKIKQLLTILIDNAVKYSAEPVDVNCGRAGEKPFISVVDKGIGIKEEDLPKIFDRFSVWMKRETVRRAGLDLACQLRSKLLKSMGLS